MTDPNTFEGKLLNLANQIADLNIETLIKPALAAGYTFEPQRQLFENIHNYFTDIKVANLSRIPDSVMATMFNLSGELFNSLNEIKNFNVRQGDPNQNYNQLASRLLDRWQQFYNFSISHIGYAKVSSAAVVQECNSIKQTLNEIQLNWAKIVTDYKFQKEADDKKLTERISEFEKVLAAAREVSGKAAVSRQALEFETEARGCLIASRLWFVATVCVIVASLFIVYWMFLEAPQKSLTAAATQTITTSATNDGVSTNSNHAITIEALQQTVARILIITLLYSVVVWVARNYFANRHNYTVNRHRRNAMQTFRAFVEGTEDKATQDFILRQAAACAFAPQQTGYLKDESLPTPAPSSPIIDIVRPGGN